MENATPMLRQYLEIKRLYPGTLLFFRLGDFYELFNEDAITGARELQITLTARHKDSANPIPMCGVPHHAAANYIARLVRKGYRIAICEQAEQATKGTKLVKREVVRVITPGTAVDQQLLDSNESVFLASVCQDGDVCGAALLDVSTGVFSATQITGVSSWDAICECVESFAPREIVATEPIALKLRQRFNGGGIAAALPGMSTDTAAVSSTGPAITEVDDSFFDDVDGTRLLKDQFHVRELDAFGLRDRTSAVCAAAAALRYAKETQRAAAEHITDIAYFESVDSMILDPVTLRNLEIVETRTEAGSRSLFQLLN
jgi:DNA mismatch repair protein MutS